jgi:hypothetical protein
MFLFIIIPFTLENYNKNIFLFARILNLHNLLLENGFSQLSIYKKASIFYITNLIITIFT